MEQAKKQEVSPAALPSNLHFLEKKPKKEKPVDLKVKYKRLECENLLKRQFFYTQSFEIYGGVSGFYDFGPLGATIKANIESLWRNHFILEDDMLEIFCSNIMLEEVLKTSVS